MLRAGSPRRRRTSAATWGLGGAVVCVGVVVLALAHSDRSGGAPAGDERESSPDRYAAFMMEEEVPQPLTASRGGDRGVDPEATASAAAERRVRLTEQMSRVGTNRVIASEGGGDGVMADSLRGGSLSGDLDEIMANVRGVQPAGIGGGGAGSAYGRGAGAAEDAGGKGRRIRKGVLASTFVAGGGVAARLDDLLDRGVVVGGEHVRLAAFEDRTPLPYPVPAEEAVAMYAQLERARVSARGDRVHLQIALVGKQGEAPPRPRMDVRLVLDRSGSMSGEKWRCAVTAAHAPAARARRVEVSLRRERAREQLRRVTDRLEETAIGLAAHRAGRSRAPGVDALLAALSESLDTAVSADEEARSL